MISNFEKSLHLNFFPLLIVINACISNPCLNNAVCQPSSNGFTCSCLVGFTGTLCQTSTSTTTACSSNPCFNGATCQPSGTSAYVCFCPTGFTGTNCQTAQPVTDNTNVCSVNSCSNGGACFKNSLGLQSCQCTTGFSGTSCQYQATCSGSPCQNGATCINQGSNSYYCQCTSNYYGKNCEYALSAQLCSVGDQDSAQCSNWSLNGFCSFAYTYAMIPVPVYCPSSCSICKSSCADSQTNCVLWKEMGFCPRINNVDPSLCRLSCGNCS